MAHSRQLPRGRGVIVPAPPTRMLLHILGRHWPVAVAGSAALSLHGIEVGRLPSDTDLVLFGAATPLAVAEALRTTSPPIDLTDGLRLAARLPVTCRGQKFDLLFPGLMAATAPPPYRSAADRLVADSEKSVLWIQEVPVVGATEVVAWKILMSGGDPHSKHACDLRHIIKHGLPTSIDVDMILAHVQNNTAADSPHTTLAKSLMSPKPWWSGYK
jgi:hypothetical protein